jgi:hypothetical protein
MNLNELSNEEVLFLYFSNLRWLQKYEDIFKEEGINDTLNIIDLGRVSVFTKLTEEELEDLAVAPHYTFVKNINNKLESIAYLIEETDPELFKTIEESFNQATV